MAEEWSEIKLVLSGDRQAIRRFVEAYRKLVSHIVFRMIPAERDREDVCQNVFLKVFENLPSFRQDSKLSTWIGRIAYNQCLNYLEKKKVALYDDLESKEGSVDSIATTEATPLDLAEKADMGFRLRQEIAALPIKYRMIVTLYHLDEMSYGEIAAITKLPEGTVKSHLFRARRLLKERLIARYGKEEKWQ
jgi:RNA polymerase sigma-70 factor (ECF subfamily)